MKLAIPVWQDRVSPVFDVAEQVLVVELEGEAEVSRRYETLPDELPDRRARRMADLGVESLICGAISRPLESFLGACRIQVFSRICGNVEEVLHAFRTGTMTTDQFAMPGCCGRKRRRRRNRCGRGRQFMEE